ncbi:ABC transporter permease [Gracilimonas sp.]|uniref:ABC transporter permease n=1 Tax=Gracilimonas sp. TaxID=1974203 RepID=UPI003BAAA1CF
MLKNYIKIALRNLRKNKIDSAISIGGLTVGLACCILLVFYVRFEWSHDNFHQNGDRLFRITEQTTSPNSGEVHKNLSMPYPLGAALDSTFPEIDKVIKVSPGAVHINEENKFRQVEVLFSEPGFFEAFTFPIAYGNKVNPLQGPDKVVLTKEAAHHYFGKEDVVGKTLTFKFNEDEYDLVVSAVAENPPGNSSLQFTLLLPFENYFRKEPSEQRKSLRNNWYIGFGETWVLLDSKSSAEKLEAKFSGFLQSQFGNYADKLKMKMGLQPLEGAYFDQEYQSYITGNTNLLYSSILGGIALVILIIAGMNFMSLTLSRASQRSHEIGIRKAAGAHKRQVSLQLIGEVFVTCSIATLLALMLAELASPFFQTLTGKAFEVSIISDPVLWLSLLSIVLLITFITGGYPAFSMSRKNTVLMFSSKRSTERIPLFVKGLITAQFTLSIAFLIATFTMNSQLSFLLNKDLGFDASNVITVEFRNQAEAAKQAELFTSEALRLSGVEQVAKIGGAYRSDPRMVQSKLGFGMGTLGSSTTLEGFDNRITSEIIDEHYLEVMDMRLLEGRNFSLSRPSDIENGIIINEKFAEIMGWENPVGKVIQESAERWSPPFDGKEVIGVVENFHFRPLHEQLHPIALQHLEGTSFDIPGTVLVKVRPGMLSETVDQLSTLWKEVLPSSTFNFSFLDELVEMQYMEEQRWQDIIRFSSFIAIALACFGLFGLATLSAQKRTKEIGIRKVLGATVSNIVALLSKDFIQLVLIGFVTAIPIAWYAMNQWLADFAYRIEIGPGIFALAGGAALIIALLTVSWQSIKAAVANPVDSLRSE